MFHSAAIIAIILALCFLLLGIRLFFDKPFVHTHIDGNEALNKRGITCVHETDRRERRRNRYAVSEKTKQATTDIRTKQRTS
ncbi:MAG: hypothetical protein IJ729_05200 [Alloprevotella sp.]|nr:hypothetical protein [Alloprevotella sp.]